MKHVAKLMLVLALVVVLVSSAAADDKKKKKKKEAKGPSGVKLAQKFLKNIDLSDEQKKQIDKIGQEFSAKMADVRKALQSAVPAEVRKARREAMKAAKEAGKKGKELAAAVDEAAPLPEDAKKAINEAQGSLKKTMADFKAAVLGVLTEEQKAQLPKPKKGKKKADKE